MMRAATIEGRRSAGAAGDLEPIQGQQRRQAFTGQLVTRKVQKDDKQFVELDGYATVFGQSYKMWDWYGEYDEQVASTACDATLAKSPDVAFLLNHTGMTMARTTAGTLTLTAEPTGLRSIAQLNPQRGDVQDLVHAVEDGAIDQMSFAFRIINGRWNEDYTVYTITEVDLDRGDVSAVNFGANPYTSINARALQAFDAIRHLDGAPLEAARRLAASRINNARRGRNVATLRSLLDQDLT